ncbi:MAG: hypothetical protein OXE84_07300 [Rhodobacteraceae bacterium]|nr:hypothetical protein [Paracoccaceae bacterium]MCY4196786.1 hypothetical protein [Paracoccaceae bacterium]
MRTLEDLDLEVVNASKRRQFAVLLNVTPPRERFTIVITAALIVSIAAWAMFARVDTSTLIDAVLIKPGIYDNTLSAHSGYLAEHLVAEGDRVARGDPIARLTVQEFDQEIEFLRRWTSLLIESVAQDEMMDGRQPTDAMAVQKALVQTEAYRDSIETVVAHREGEIVSLQPALDSHIPAGSPIALIRDEPAANDGLVKAVVRTPPYLAAQFEVGMRAEIFPGSTDGKSNGIAGEIIKISAAPLPEWLAKLNPSVDPSLYRVDILSSEAGEQIYDEGTPGQVRVVLGEKTPFAILLNAVRNMN